MSEHDISLVTSKAGAVVAENLKLSLATPSASLTPATFTAMIGINQGSALTLSNSVQVAMSNLTGIAANTGGIYSANVVTAATTALSSMTSFQSSLGFGGTPNHAAFGSFLNQAQNHIKDSIEMRKATDFMANMSYSDLGSGITDLGSSVDQGLTSTIGDLPSAGAMMASAGTMFNGVDIKNFGSPLGIVKALQSNKLGNYSGVNSALSAAGVPLADLDNPVYADKIAGVLAGIKNPNIINTVAEQFNISPTGGLPPAAPKLSRVVGSDTGSWEVFADSVDTGASIRVVGSSGRIIYTGSPTSVIQDINDTIEFNTVTEVDPAFDTQFFENLRTTVGNLEGELQDAVMNSTSIQSLADVGDPTKLDPSSASGVSGGVPGLTVQLNNMGAASIKNASAAPGLFGMIQSVQTPLSTASFPDLGGLIKDHQSTIDSLTGSGNGPLGLPSMTDFTEHLAGGPSITSFLQNVGNNVADAISALTSSISSAAGLFTTAGVDLTTPPPNTLGTAMSFAQNLHKYGADTSGSGIADVLHNLADTSTAYGEAIKASLAEGKNAKLLADNAMPPVVTTPSPPAPDKETVNYPVTVSRQFPRTSGPGTGTFVTLSAVANSSSDVLWRLENGDYTTVSGYGPYAVMYSGDYTTLYTSAKERSVTSDPGVSPDVVRILPQLKAELDSQMSGGSPKALG